MDETPPAVTVHKLTKYYGELCAVDHVSFEVHRGEFFGLLGPNGAGKTTTIRMLTGIITKNDGDARVMGFPAGSIAAKQMSGVMPELSNAYVDLTAWGNLMLTAALYRVPRAQAKARTEALLEQLGLWERKDSLASTYSMGMRKRLVLSMALLPDPQILFLDEPTSGLDVQSVRFMRAMLRQLKQAGKTIVLTTHNMDEAAEMCERVAVINHGQLVALDTPEHLSITAGHVYLLDVSFDQPVSPDVLTKLPGVHRLETAQAIAAAETLRAQKALAGVGRPGGRGGAPGNRPAPQAGGAPAGLTGTVAGPEAGMGADGLPGGARVVGKPPEQNRFQFYTENTTLLMTTLVDFSREHALTMHILNVRPPSLEDAFVRLTEEKRHAQ